MAYTSDREGFDALYWQPVDGGPAERLTQGEAGVRQRPDSWSAKGPRLAFRRRTAESAGIFTLVPGGPPEPFHDQVGSAQYEAAFSPDGNWVAYTSTETGRDEVFIQPFPPTGAKVRVTRDGGTFPVWSAGGRELVYRRSFDAQLYRSQGARLLSVPVTTEGGLGVGPERQLAAEGFLVFHQFRDYDVTRDGTKLLLVYPAEGAPGPLRISIVENWTEELRARGPESLRRRGGA